VGMNVSKRPENILPIQPCLDLRILTDVNGIVEIDEVVPQSLRKDDPGNRGQPEGNRDSQDELGAHNSDGIKVVPAGAQTSCRS